MLHDKAPGVHWSPFELYDFVGGPTRPASLMIDRGLLPWFTDDGLTLRFFRPLSSAMLAMDARLFGERTWLARLHSLLWFLAILGLVAVLHRRLLSPSAAGVATLIYAISAGHALPVSWIAARHTLVCTAFSLLTFWLHLRVREDG
jgi:4-amino-4-deoxy-L-arabinose transferase-like glycosyltransferase